MIDTTTLLTYAAVELGLFLIPGPAVLLVLARSVTGGPRVGVATGFGIALGDLVHTAMATFGLSAVLMTSALAFSIVKYAGVIYLIVLGIRALFETNDDLHLPAAQPVDPRRAFRQAIWAEMLNPKTALFFLAFLPQFIAADEAHVLARMLELSGAFMAMTFAVFALYGLCAAAVRDRVVSRPRVMAWLRRSFAAGFAALGARLAFADR